MFNEFLDVMARGGPIMWVIFSVTWLSIVLLVERCLSIVLWKKEVGQWDTVSIDSTHPLHDLANELRAMNSPSSFELDEKIAQHLSNAIPKLEGSLPTIAILASLLPMLGLLGTVTGMIDVFHVIAAQGTGDPKAMADGISQALLTTASGLITAIPIIFIHHLQLRNIKNTLLSTSMDIKNRFEFQRDVYHECP